MSGLPIKNDIRHVGEIASMSLDLLSAVRQHKISHRPNEMLKLRIGMNIQFDDFYLLIMSTPRENSREFQLN